MKKTIKKIFYAVIGRPDKVFHGLIIIFIGGFLCLPNNEGDVILLMMACFGIMAIADLSNCWLLPQQQLK